jgi:hypothetical protein
MFAIIITAVVSFIGGYIAHDALTKYLRAAEAKAIVIWDKVKSDADKDIKKL